MSRGKEKGEIESRPVGAIGGWGCSLLFLGGAELVQLLHQSRFAARSVILLDNAFLGSSVESAEGFERGFFGRGRITTVRDHGVGFFDLGASCRPNYAIADLAACALTNRFFSGMCVCQRKSSDEFLSDACDNTPIRRFWQIEFWRDDSREAGDCAASDPSTLRSISASRKLELVSTDA